MIIINAILALGLNLIFGHTGQISIGQAGFYAIGAYTSAILEVKFGISFLLAWPSAIVLTAIIAAIIGIPILKLHGHYLAMATIAFGMIVETMATNWISITGGHAGVYVPAENILGSFIASKMYFVIVIVGILLYIICENIEYSRVGRAIRAVREDENGASSIGIKHSKYKVIMFVVGAIFSAIAGIIYVHLNSVITPEVFNMETSILILMMVIVGGIGSNIGVVLGSVFITLLPELLYGFLEYNILVYGILICLSLIFLPQGLHGLIIYVIETIKKLIYYNYKIENEGE